MGSGMNASNEEISSETESPETEAHSISDILESLREHLAEEARRRRERERTPTKLQQEHIEWRTAYRERLATETEAYFRAHPEAQAQDGEAEQADE